MKILVTGAAGIVGTAVRPYLADAFDEVQLTDLDLISDLSENESCVVGDLCQAEFTNGLVRQSEGCALDGIVHLAGLVGPDYSFDEVLQPNIVATHYLLQAARRYGVKRFVFASSHHAVGYFPRGAPIDHRTAPRPDSWYGLSKATGELQCSHASDAYGLGVMCIRIGNVGKTVTDERRLHLWSSARDLAALIMIGMRGTQTGYHLTYGVSRCPHPFFDNRHAESLGYSPLDSSLDHLADPSIAENSIVESQDGPVDPMHGYIGGHFATQNPRSDQGPSDTVRDTVREIRQ